MKNRSIFKKVGAGIMAAAMMVGLVGSTSVFALAPDASMKGSLTVHKFSATTEPDTSQTNDSGEKIPDTSGLGEPLKGAGFTLYKLDDMPALQDGDKYTGGYTISNNNDTITITFDAVDEKGNTSAHTYTLAGNTTPVSLTIPDPTPGDPTHTKTITELITGDDGTVNWYSATETQATPSVGLDQGNYLLVETTTPDGYTASVSTIVSIPLTNKAGTGFNFDIHAYPKNISDTPITKKLDDTSKFYQPGDEVKFTISSAFENKVKEEDYDEVKDGQPLTDEEKAAYKKDKVDSVKDLYNAEGTTDAEKYGDARIEDTLSASLVYVSSVVSYTDAKGNKVLLEESTTPGDGKDYTLEGNGATPEKLVWKLTHEGIKKVAEADPEAKSLKVELVTKLKANGNAAVENSATSIMTKAGGTEPVNPPITPPVKVPTANVEIDKVDAENSDAALNGATFGVALGGITGDNAYPMLLTDGNTVLVRSINPSGVNTVEYSTDDGTTWTKAADMTAIEVSGAKIVTAISQGGIYNLSNGNTVQIRNFADTYKYEYRDKETDEWKFVEKLTDINTVGDGAATDKGTVNLLDSVKAYTLANGNTVRVRVVDAANDILEYYDVTTRSWKTSAKDDAPGTKTAIEKISTVGEGTDTTESTVKASVAAIPMDPEKVKDLGIATFNGLPGYNGSADVKYYLVELSAPAGYQLKKDAIEVTVPHLIKAGEKIGENESHQPILQEQDEAVAAKLVSTTVENYQGSDPDNKWFSLPLTGGTGTIMFLIIGGIVMAGAIVAYARSKKKVNA